MPNACNPIATAGWPVLPCSFAANATRWGLLTILFLLLPTANGADPYQIVAPSGLATGHLTSGVGGLFGGGQISLAQTVSTLDPYATQSAATQLNAPMVDGPASLPAPIVNGPLFQGGPVYNSLRNWQPLIPSFQNRVDSRLYFRGEYLLWDVSGMDTPPLVTTSPDGTATVSAGILGQPGTAVQFGGSEINDGTASGFLVSGGLWINPQRNLALESEYFRLGELDDGYDGAGSGAVILARPYFDVVDGNQSARLIAHPDLSEGQVRVGSASKLRSFLINGRLSLCPTHGACCQQCGMRDRTDWIIGYRNLRLRDSLSVADNANLLGSNIPSTRSSQDQFRTKNEFNGLQLGVVHRILLNRAWLESSLRVAVGNTQQTLSVDGSTTDQQPGVSETFRGGLLAQRTNIGTRSRDEFMMVPELGVRLGMRLTDRLHASVGYSILYLPNVIRAAEQIDTDINPGLIPVEDDPLTGGLRPRVLWMQSDYLAHGLHFGGELHF